MKINIKKLNKVPLRATVERLSHDGRGIATVNNKKVFIAGGLPQEEVSYALLKKRSSYHEAIVEDIHQTSSNRVEPICKHFGICGGCSLQHLHHEAQVAFKEKMLLEQLSHFGHVTPETIVKPLTAEPRGYRRKARLGVKFVTKKNKVLVGFREKSKRYLADLNDCQILHPNVGMRLEELSELIRTLSIYDAIPQIEIAVGDITTAFVFRHMQPFSTEDKTLLKAYAEKNNIHIYLQGNAQILEKLWPNDDSHRLTYCNQTYAIQFQFHPLDFTQINFAINEKMVVQAINWLAVTPEDEVLDLFCGIGNFSLPLARLAAHVTGIEGSQEMVARAYENAQHNQIGNVKFFMSNLFDVTAKENWHAKRYTKVLLDPPRAGALEILPYLNELNPQKIVYVSCNAATLARDAGELVNRYGYRLMQIGVMDMFPHTSHIEAMALFER